MLPRPNTLLLEPYRDQRSRWPSKGRHLLAQFDDRTVVVYQAYRPSIARYAASHGRLGGPEFSRTRMTWIKPNFLWMMFRCGWATKENQEAVLAIRLAREGFDAILAQAVASSYVPELYASREEWSAAVNRSHVRLQWDPDHHPSGAPTERRAIQLGLRGEVLERFIDEWTVGIEDITPFVAAQRPNVAELEQLVTPREDTYMPRDPAIARHIGLEGVEGE